MRKIPIPLLVAALVAVAAIGITMKVSVSPVPVYADANITGVIPAGNVGYWKGAFTEAVFNTNTTVNYKYFYGAAIVVYAPNGIRNDTRIVNDNNLGGFIRLISGSGAYLITSYPGGYYVAVKLVPIAKGLYIGQQLTTSELEMINKITKQVYTMTASGSDETTQIYTMTGSGYDATKDLFYVTLLNAKGCTTTIYMSPAGRGTGNNFVIKGYDVNVNNIVVRYVTGVAIIPSANANVTIYVK